MVYYQNLLRSNNSLEDYSVNEKVISGKVIGQQIREEIQERVERLKEQGVTPGLAVIIVGDDPASHTYVRNKQKSSLAVGMKSELIELPVTVTEEELLKEIHRLNEDDTIHGILVQLPLPEHIDEDRVILTIDPAKDVDGFHPENVGKMIIGQRAFLSCTPYGIVKLLERTNTPIKGQHAVIVGRSNIVGKPMGQLLLQRDATVTYTH